MRRLLSSAAAIAVIAVCGGVAGGLANAEPADVQPMVSSSVVINEVATRGPNGQLDEFIELRNVSSNPIDLTGWVLKIYNAQSQEIDEIEITAAEAVVLEPRGNVNDMIVLTGPNFSGTVQTPTRVLPFFLEPLAGIPDNGGVALFNPADAKVDGVAFSNSAVIPREGVAARSLAGVDEQLGASSARDVLSTDTDNNRVDFTLHMRTPGALN